MEIPRDRNGNVNFFFFGISISSFLAKNPKGTIEARAADGGEVEVVIDSLSEKYIIESEEVANGYNLKISARS